MKSFGQQLLLTLRPRRHQREPRAGSHLQDLPVERHLVRDSQRVAVLVELRLGQLEQPRDKQLALVADEQRERLSARDLRDRERQQRLHHHRGELGITPRTQRCEVDLLIQPQLPVVPVTARQHGPVAREEQRVVLSAGDLRFTPLRRRNAADALASQLVQHHRLERAVHVESLPQLSVRALAPRVHAARGGQAGAVAASADHRRDGRPLQRGDLPSMPPPHTTARGTSLWETAAPSPSCPRAPAPHASSPPSSVRQKACDPPAATRRGRTEAEKKADFVGVLSACSLEAMGSWCALLEPQA